jgi:hypothetical protein
MRHLASAQSALLSLLGAATFVALGGAARTARADEPRKVTEPSVLNESAEVTSVVDAFDDDDKFDLHLSLGFEQTWKSGKVLRETTSSLPQYSSGGYTASNMSVASYSQSVSRLNTRADIGLYKDIALILRMPIILSNDQKLGDLDGSASHQALILQGAPGEQLFSLPFKSPTRSGIEYFAVGLDVSPMNQMRDRTKPTWTLGVEGRFSVSEPMHPCGATTGLNQPGGQVACANTTDINRDGKGAQVPNPSVPGSYLDGSNFSGGNKPGVSRGTTGLEAHTFISKRVKYIEPYTGFVALFEFQNSNSEFGATDLQGSLVNHPPFQGTLIGGLAIIPWEVRDQFQRVEIDLRASGTYRSEGRDYSPLFDALGSSDAPSLRRPTFASFQANTDPGTRATSPSVVNPASQTVYTTGITDVQQHGIYTLATKLTFQAGEYVKFNVGGSFTAEQGHIITLDQPCNPDFNNNAGAAGPCHSVATVSNNLVATGIPNPNYRAVIDAPGRRFLVSDMTIWDAWVNAVVMF